MSTEHANMKIEGDILKQYTGEEKVVVVPSGIKTIASGAFFGFHGIEEIIIPETVENIETHAIVQCFDLKHLVIKGQPEITSIWGNFELVYANDSLRSAGPLGSGADYEYGWKESIPNGAFTNLKK